MNEVTRYNRLLDFLNSDGSDMDSVASSDEGAGAGEGQGAGGWFGEADDDRGVGRAVVGDGGGVYNGDNGDTTAGGGGGGVRHAVQRDRLWPVLQFAVQRCTLAVVVRVLTSAALFAYFVTIAYAVMSQPENSNSAASSSSGKASGSDTGSNNGTSGTGNTDSQLVLWLGGVCTTAVVLLAILRVRQAHRRHVMQQRLHDRMVRQMRAFLPRTMALGLVDRDFTAEDYERLLELDEDTPTTRLRGATQPQINRLPTFTYKAPCTKKGEASDDSDKNTCRICLGEFEDGDVLRMVPCFHRFHQQCIDRWLLEKAECPVCKASARGNDQSIV